MTTEPRKDRFTMAAVQQPSAFWDRAAGTDRALTYIAAAAGRGVDVVCFGEGWLPGYPFFSHSLPSELALEVGETYLANAILIPGPETEALCAAAREHEVDVVIGVGELDPSTAGSVYCTLLFIGREGRVLGRHRKLKPTYLERLVWSDGDAAGLVAYPRPYARISGLNCWEHQMMLPGYALAAQGTEVHVAAWPGWEPETWTDDVSLREEFWPRMHLLSRAYASQAATYVVAVAGMWRPKDVPRRLRSLVTRPRTGDSIIISPSGRIIAGPLRGRPGIIVGRGSLAEVRRAKGQVDVAGHYARPDIFDFDWDARARVPASRPDLIARTSEHRVAGGSHPAGPDEPDPGSTRTRS
jgi:predicted amidohydrolase